ncbi:mitochondrial escape protein 2 [Mortierella sp. AM989]|nr:mitochondrial escape protein 2 [Mortierella sp. AM989]
MYRAATFCRPSLRVNVSAPLPRRQILFAPSSITSNHSSIPTAVRTFKAVPQVSAATTASAARTSIASVSAKPIPFLRTSKAPAVKTAKRNYTSQTPEVEGERDLQYGMLYFDNVYPLKMGWWDFRDSIMKPGWRSLERKAKNELVPPENGMPFEFKVGGIEPRLKDGGMYVHFSYIRPESYTTREALKEIESRCEQHLIGHNHYMWFNLQKVRAFLVKGTPFLEDMASRYPNKKVRVEYTGDMNVEGLYTIFRKYGKIIDIITVSGKESPKEAIVQFSKIRASTSAKCALHGAEINGIKLNVTYERKMQGNVMMAWINEHAKIIVPAVAIVIAGLSLLILDPIREFSMYAKITQMFSVEEYRIMRWLRKETVGRLTRAASDPLQSKGWREREVDEEKLRNWLHVPPETFAVIYGPRGSGKTEMVKKAIKGKNNRIIINCEDLAGARSESELLSFLAQQIGYTPLFQFIPMVMNLVDTAVAAAGTGSKSGLAPSFEEQLQSILDCLTVAIQDASPTSSMSNSSAEAILKKIEATIEEKARRALKQIDDKTARAMRAARKRKEHDAAAGWCDPDDIPVVIIDGYMYREKAEHAMEFWSHIAEWAAILVENHLAHVVFVTDNVAATKPLSKALPSMTLESIVLADASLESALEFVYKHLDREEFPDLIEPIQTIGGRLTDLQLFVQKIKSGRKPEDAVLDIKARAVVEVRKGAFDFDSEDDRILGWTPLQFWTVMKRLASGDPANFDELRIHPLFKNEEAPFAAMEQAELISIVHKNGRPFAVRPGKPIYTAAFQDIVADVGFCAVMDIESASRLEKEEMANVAKWEAELKELSSLMRDDGSWLFGGGKVPKEVDARVKWLMTKLAESHAKIEKYEQDITAAKQAIARLNASVIEHAKK